MDSLDYCFRMMISVFYLGVWALLCSFNAEVELVVGFLIDFGSWDCVEFGGFELVLDG